VSTTLSILHVSSNFNELLAATTNQSSPSLNLDTPRIKKKSLGVKPGEMGVVTTNTFSLPVYSDTIDLSTNLTVRLIQILYAKVCLFRLYLLPLQDLEENLQVGYSRL
jgi:hypothetical protein